MVQSSRNGRRRPLPQRLGGPGSGPKVRARRPALRASMRQGTKYLLSVLYCRKRFSGDRGIVPSPVPRDFAACPLGRECGSLGTGGGVPGDGNTTIGGTGAMRRPSRAARRCAAFFSRAFRRASPRRSQASMTTSQSVGWYQRPSVQIWAEDVQGAERDAVDLSPRRLARPGWPTRTRSAPGTRSTRSRRSSVTIGRTRPSPRSG